jgi:hypothetical protein
MTKSLRDHFSVWSSRQKTRLKSQAFKDAFAEVAATVVTATLPIWFFPLVSLFLVGLSYSLTLLDHSISEGELFLFCTSLVGPLLYILFRIYEVPETDRHRHIKYRISLVFPHGLKFAAIVFFVCIIAAAIFGLQKINPKFSGGDISKGGYITLSVILFVISILSLLAASTLRNEMDSYSPSKLMRKQEDDFATRYQAGETTP